jgi:hypothetical protein
MSRTPRIAGLLAISLSVTLAAGCHALRLGQLTQDRPEREPASALAPTRKSEFRVSQFVFLHDFPIDRNLPLFQELSGLREQLYKDLQLPPSNTPIFVHLFENQPRYEAFMQRKYPNLPKRRAFFIADTPSFGGGEQLLVYTYWGDRINQDLRHELTHALLHSVLKDVPIWLDEGLAEYFELSPGWKGINYQHLAQLRRGPNGPVQPDLGRLEQLSKVEQMTPAEYREAWAWVHLMLHTKAEARRVLIGYLRELRTNPQPGLLRPRLAPLFPSLDEALQAHLARLDSGRPPSTTAKR